MQKIKKLPYEKLIGQYRTFGAFGPAYQILKAVKAINEHDWLLRIKLLATGEKTDYRFTHAINDPEA